jgi:hypothetical protein
MSGPFRVAGALMILHLLFFSPPRTRSLVAPRPVTQAPHWSSPGDRP